MLTVEADTQDEGSPALGIRDAIARAFLIWDGLDAYNGARGGLLARPKPPRSRQSGVNAAGMA